MSTAQPQQTIKYDDLMDALEKYEASTSTQAQDLTTAEYERDNEFGSLTWPSGEKHELNEWSARQLCRATGVPFGIFRKASEKLSQDMFKEFVPSMKDPQVKIALKSFGQSKQVIRGILPIDYPDVRNSEVLGALRNVGTDFEVESAGWMDTPNPAVLRTRVIFPSFNKTVNNEELKIGMDITSSELGGCPLQNNLLLFREVCKNGAIATYGRKPYFYFDYSAANMAVDLGDVFTAAVNRAGDDLDNFMARVEAAVVTPFSLDKAQESLMNAVKEGALNKGVVLKTLSQLEKDGCATAWDFINGLTAQARGFRDILRLKYETAAGFMIGLNFDRNQDENDFALESPELPLLQATN